jgi:hypothetical protein
MVKQTVTELVITKQHRNNSQISMSRTGFEIPIKVFEGLIPCDSTITRWNGAITHYCITLSVIIFPTTLAYYRSYVNAKFTFEVSIRRRRRWEGAKQKVKLSL